MNMLSIDEALNVLKGLFGKAKELLADHAEIEKLLQQLEKKLELIPVAGEHLAKIPVIASLLRSYIIKEYTDIPSGSVIAIVAALLYFVSPIDLIPDSIPVAGLTDDALVIAACWKLVESDVMDYEAWREKNAKLFNT